MCVHMLMLICVSICACVLCVCVYISGPDEAAGEWSGVSALASCGAP